MIKLVYSFRAPQEEALAQQVRYPATPTIKSESHFVAHFYFAHACI